MSQNADILEALKAGSFITPISALQDYGCMRLAARIDNIRKMGIQVRTEIIERRGKRFARYSL